MAIREALVYEGQKPTKEELAEIEAADKRPINFEDIPEMTADEMAVVAVMAQKRRSAQKKKTVSIRLPQDTIDKAKSMLGEVYKRFHLKMKSAKAGNRTDVNNEN